VNKNCILKKPIDLQKRENLLLENERFPTKIPTKITVPETDIAPENGWLEDDFLSFWEVPFSGASC